MNRLLIFSVSWVLCLFTTYAQLQSGFNYQAALRSPDHTIMANQSVVIRVTLTNENSTLSYYCETHQTSTNSQGIINLVIGGGTVVFGNFDQIPWETGNVYLKVELESSNGSFVSLGTSKIVPVPYAMFAKKAEGAVTGTGIPGKVALWSGETTLTNLTALNIDPNVAIVSNPNASDDDPIFEVKNKQGQVVFAVYQKGVRVYVSDDESRSIKGGFAVGGLSSGKTDDTLYMKVTPDSVKILFRENANKSVRGGFAVGGLSSGKARYNLLEINPDSTRVYFKQNSTKSLKGGFAVGGLSSGKPTPDNLMNLTPENYFIGHKSGENISLTSRYNSVIGYNAGMSLFSGSKNTVLGAFAGKMLSHGNSNIIIGNSAGYNITTGSNNVLIGDSAGFMGNGFRAIIIGNNAGKNSTNFSESLFIGNGAGENDISSFSNTFIGNLAGNKNTTGRQNTFIGNHAGFNNTTGTSNVFIGNYAAFNNVSGGQNVFIGEMAGYSNTTTGGNVFIGFFSGYNNTGYGNSFLGNYSGYANTTGYANTFIGNGAGGNNTTGTHNTYVGQNCGNHNQTGSHNSFFGQSAGLNLTSGDLNVFLGYGAGYYVTQGQRNVFIGPWAGAQASGNDRLYITNSFTDSTQSLIFGRFDQKTLSFKAKVGINTINPDKDLHVVGDARITGDIYYGTGNNTYNKPDYVFLPDYNRDLSPLEVESFIRENGHLPWFTKATQENDGINLTRMQFETVETVENLQLQIIRQQKEIDRLKAELEAIKQMLNK